MRWNLAALLAATLFTSSCAGALSSAPSKQGGDAMEVQVASPPPPEKTEARSGAPGFGYIWVSGYWDYLDGNYIWREGRWMQGKREFEYVRARYEFDGKRWIFHRPHWKRRHTATATASAVAK